MKAELARLTAACVNVAEVLDTGERDPRWSESQELEEAAIAYGRAVRNQVSEPTTIAGTRATVPPPGRSSRSCVAPLSTPGKVP